MMTNLEIDENLIKEALELSGYSDQSAVIAEALKQYIKLRKQQEIKNYLVQLNMKIIMTINNKDIENKVIVNTPFLQNNFY